MNDPKITLKECIEQLEWCDYQCEGGMLKCNVAFRQIKRAIETGELK